MNRTILVNSPAALLAIITAALVSLGLVMVYSASGARAGLETRRIVAEAQQLPEESFEFHHSGAYLKRQAMWTVAGLAMLALMMRVPIAVLEKWAPWILLACLVALLAVVVTPLGVTSKGARRWMRLGPFTIQPSEFAKIGLVVFMAHFLSKKRDEIRDWKRGFLPTMAIWGVFAALVLLERDLGTIILMGAVMIGMWCLARMKMMHLASLVLVSIPALVFLIFQHSYRINRLLAFMNPDAYANTTGYQLRQSLIAVGSGGLWGRGLGLGLQKYHFLSEAHTDFIFSIVCEELGLVGALGILLLFLSFVLIGLRIAHKAPDQFGALLAAGMTLMIGWAVFINFFVTLGLGPTKGLALPFFSYGGSSMIASLACVGILLNVANYSFVRRRSEGALA